MIKPLQVKDEEQMTRLWIHEVSRVFHDRMINEQDRRWYYALIVEMVTRRFSLKWNEEDIFGNQSILFGDLFKIDTEQKDYEEIKDIKKVIQILDE